MNEGKITLYIASSLDGFIATEDGGVSWLESGDGGNDSALSDDYETFVGTVDCLLFGSKTYEQVLTFGEWPYGQKPTYVITSRDLPLVNDSVEIYNGDIYELTHQLKKRYNHIWLVGGAKLAQTMLEAKKVDELRLNVIPILLKKGIPLFGSNGGEQTLQLLDTTEYGNGSVELHYEINP